MSRFAHHASRRAAEAEAGFAHACYVAVPALLWAVAMLVAVAATALRGTSVPAPAQAVSGEQSPVTVLGA